MKIINENPDLGESMMAELAVRGVIDDVSLTVATVQNPDSFKSLEVLDGTGPYKKQRRQEFHLTKSVDRHQMNSDFVSNIT